jgi:hypothetical protein
MTSSPNAAVAILDLAGATTMRRTGNRANLTVIARRPLIETQTSRAGL